MIQDSLSEHLTKPSNPLPPGHPTEGNTTSIVTAEPSASKFQNLKGISTENLFAELIQRLDASPDRDGLLDTPKRAAKAMRFLTGGSEVDPRQILRSALFAVDFNEMVIVRDIEMYSLCEHHMLPFFGKVHVAYIPKGKVIGLSKLPRMVDAIARRLQVQERITQQIAEAIDEAVRPQGVGVVIEAQHLCMMMRGVEKQHSQTVTSATRGSFRTQPTRSEFLSLVSGNSRHFK